MSVEPSVIVRPRKLLLYGPQGVGKSKLIAETPGAYVVDLEEGTNDFKCRRWPKTAIDYGGFQDAINWLLTYGKSDGVKIAVFDSLTRAQEIVHSHLCKQKQVASIAEIGGGFGKGEKLAVAEFNHIRASVDALVRSGIAVVLIAHATEVKHTPPDAPAYTEYAPDLTEDVRDMFVRYCDEVFFMRQQSYQQVEKTGFGGERSLNKQTQTRQLVTSNNGAICAKHRLGMGVPDVIDASMFPHYVARLAPPMTEPTPLPVVEVSAQAIETPTETGSPWAIGEPSNEAAAELASTTVFG